MNSEVSIHDSAWWAAIEHHRHWLATDGCYIREIELSGLTLELARHIAREYRVTRTIAVREGKEGKSESTLPALLDAIKSSKWPDRLTERAQVCIELAKQHANATHAKMVPISAVTKLMWFLRPEGWTMFDQYARKGLIGYRNDAGLFYERLEELNFGSVSAQLQEACKSAGFPGLYGERIIDKCLMLHGGGNEAAFVQTTTMVNRHYLGLLPTEVADRLKRLADSSTSILRESNLPTCAKLAPRSSKALKMGAV